MDRPLLNRRCPRRSTAARAFTLVELVTAASLMTVMMMGVVQIFAIVTQTAADAQGLHFAQEQARALFDVLHRDIRGLTREGYIKIVKNAPIWPPLPATGGVAYSADTLAFTSVGYWENAQQLGQTPVQATAAEVVYTSNVRTPDLFLKVGSTATPVDPRRGILARGVWQITDKPGGSSGGDWNDRSAAQTLAELTTTGPAHVTVQPLSLVSFGTTTRPWTLRRVMASCVSEFYVEYLDMPSTMAAGTWKSDALSVVGSGGGTAKIPSGGGSIRAIRVTVAIHDPDDRKPLVPGTPGVVSRFQGYALQEVFWLGDP